MRIDFIGAGLMGHGMVLSLQKGGHEVSVIAHRNRAPIEDLLSKGAPGAASLDKSPTLAILCPVPLLLKPMAVQTVAALKPGPAFGQTIIDTGTSEPKSTRLLAGDLAPLVCLCGRAVDRRAGTGRKSELGVLCGASPETFSKILPVFTCFATTVRHMGPVGSGHAAKLISNFLVTGMIALCRRPSEPRGSRNRLAQSLRRHAEWLGQFRSAAQNGGASLGRGL